MAIAIKTDIIYYCIPSDFEFEYNLHGYCKMRLLSSSPQNKKDLLHSLGRAVSRSQLIIAIGDFSGDNNVIEDMSKAIGYPLYEINLAPLGMDETKTLPKDSIPLITSDDCFAGCVIECGPQSIVILPADRELRSKILKELIRQYICDLYKAQSVTDSTASATLKKTEAVLQGIGEITAGTTSAVALMEKTEVTTCGDSEISAEAVPASTEELSENSTAVPEKNGKHVAEELIPIDFSSIENELFLDENNKKHQPSKHKNTFLRILIIALLLAVGVFIYIRFAEPLVIDKIYDKYSAMLGHNSDDAPDSMLDSFGMLYSYNEDTIGWLSIGGTTVNYPVVTDTNRQPGYYQKHLYNGWFNYIYGNPYSPQVIKDNSYYRNIVIYGKDTPPDRMFSSLADITTLKGYRASPIITFNSLYEQNTYKIFAAFTVNGDIPDSITTTDFFDDEAFVIHTSQLLDMSEIVTTVDIQPQDDIITLITYGSNCHTVIIARKVRPEESTLVDTAFAVLKENYDPSVPVISGTDSSDMTSTGDVSPLTEITSSEVPPASSFTPVKQTPAVSYTQYTERYEQNEPQEPADIPAAPPVVTSSSSPTSSAPPQQPSTPSDLGILTVKNQSTGVVVSGSVVDIISQIVEAEMGSSYQPEALKAQAIAAYGWLLCNGADRGNTPAVPMKTAGARVTEAVKSVAGLKPCYNDKVANTYYFAYSAGYTANCCDIWTADLPYLQSVDSSVDKNNPSFLSRRTYSAGNIAAWVKASTGVDLSTVSDKTRWFNVTYDQNGVYSKTVTFGNDSTIYKGKYLRESIFTTARVGSGNTLKSGAYTITYNSESDTFTFEVKGYGHGVGMSQYGANQYALNGWSYLDILQHYYRGITVSY